ncbi:MAG: type II toxin-antitoxin system RelE/ParE family toxin [Deltaproteobacteria bacterium]|nr:type II toxin-antitoxin system RelE/ParE family toxin [Deltaproteobacteria bacterium]MBI3389490.1 type II toxin-antitoxin system RelE/ParE family toxin [Deltaproteobacteria bacterium]
MVFAIVYSPEAVDHLAALSKATQRLVVDQVEKQLTHEPNLPTRKRKLLRPNPIAPWELRLGDVRVFYDVQEKAELLVKVAAVGIKQHNQLWIGKERIDL